MTREVLNNLQEFKQAYQWKNQDKVSELIDSLEMHKTTLSRYQFSVLFEGQGEMTAPPWGSVYQNKDNLVMGDSTALYYTFLDRCGINIEIENQPLDQFGLMLWVLAALIEDGNQVAMVELLSTHLLPWSGRYLELLTNNADSPFYADLAKLASLLLNQMQSEIGLSIEPITLFK